MPKVNGRPLGKKPSGNPGARDQDGSNPPAHKSNQKNDLPNVILITLDALNYELFVENLQVLPNLKALKSGSVFFENAFSVGPSTFFSFPGIIAGVYPYHFGIGIDRNIKAIDEVLRDCGYHTAVINEANALLTPYFGYCMNTDYQKHFLDLSHVKEDRKIADTFLIRGGPEAKPKHYPGPANLLRSLYQKLDIKWIGRLGTYCFSVCRFLSLYLTNRTERFKARAELHHQFRSEVLEFINGRFESPQFLWIHTIVNHLPYFPLEDNDQFDTREINYLNFRGLSAFVNHKVCGKLKRLHAESMKTTDRLIGDILDALRVNGRLDNSIIVLTADHGEEFMEEGYFGHSPESSSDRILHIPLIFYGPNIVQPKTISVPVSTIDILPTICDLIGTDIPDSNRGISLKEIMLRVAEDIREDERFWQRPLFSEAWETEGLLDRSPGHGSVKKIFTVRKGQYRLKLVHEQENENTIREEFCLSNWTNNEKLDAKSNSQILEELDHLLYEHIYTEGAFARYIRSRAEEQRIRKALGRMRNKK